MAMVPQPSSKDTPFHHSVVFNRVCRPFPRIFLIEGGSRISNAAFPCLSSLSPVTLILFSQVPQLYCIQYKEEVGDPGYSYPHILFLTDLIQFGLVCQFLPSRFSAVVSSGESRFQIWATVNQEMLLTGLGRIDWVVEFPCFSNTHLHSWIGFGKASSRFMNSECRLRVQVFLNQEIRWHFSQK